MADTFNFFIAGYVVIFGILGAYIGWLVWLNRRIQKKIDSREQGAGDRAL